MARDRREDYTRRLQEIMESLGGISAEVNEVLNSLVRQLDDGLAAAEAPIQDWLRYVGQEIINGTEQPDRTYDDVTAKLYEKVINGLMQAFEFSAALGISFPDKPDLPPAPDKARTLEGFRPSASNRTPTRSRRGVPTGGVGVGEPFSGDSGGASMVTEDDEGRSGNPPPESPARDLIDPEHDSGSDTDNLQAVLRHQAVYGFDQPPVKPPSTNPAGYFIQTTDPNV